MASSKEYLEYVLDLLRKVDGITFKKMMGEYLLYKNGVLFGGVYDDRFLIKKTPYSSSLGLEEALPYDGAKPMLSLDADDAETTYEIVDGLMKDLKKK